MIAAKFRIPRADISYILKKGEQFISKLFIVKYTENKEDFSRYRVIVSRKIYPKAVKRNHLRRQIYEAIRLNQGKEEGKKKDLVLIPKKNILKADYKSIEEDIKKIIHG